MKRDLELIRQLLFHIESAVTDVRNTPAIDGYSEDQTDYHCNLLIEAELVKGILSASRRGNGRVHPYIILGLTWPGHDFIDAAREPTRWNKAKKALGDATIGAYIGLLNQLAVHYATKAAGLSD